MPSTIPNVPQEEHTFLLLPTPDGSYRVPKDPEPGIVERSFWPVAIITCVSILALVINQVAHWIGG